MNIAEEVYSLIGLSKLKELLRSHGKTGSGPPRPHAALPDWHA